MKLCPHIVDRVVPLSSSTFPPYRFVDFIYLPLFHFTMINEDLHGGGIEAALHNDPTSVIISFAFTIAIFPFIVAFIVDPISQTQTTMRDLLQLYISLIFSAIVAIPIWIQLDDRQSIEGYPPAYVLAVFLSGLGISWNHVTNVFFRQTNLFRIVQDDRMPSTTDSHPGQKS